MNEQTRAAAFAHKVAYRGFTIRLKGDFGDSFFLIDGMPCAWGYVAVRNGCNAMPGATWFQTVKEAKRGIDALIAAEANFYTPAGQAKEFWRLVQTTEVTP